MYEIYTTGGGDQLVQTLNAVASFAGTNNWLAILRIGMLIGCIMVAFQVIVGASLKSFVGAYLVMALVGSLSITKTSDVIVFDKTKGALWSRTVSNVPTSVAYIGSFTSRFSEALTRRIEATYAPPTSLAYQQQGMLFGATLATKSARWRAVTAAIHENLVNFFDQCVVDAVDLRYYSPETFVLAGNLNSAIAANLPNALAYYDTTTRSTRLCKEGWPDISASLTAEVEKVIATQAAATYRGGDAAVAINQIKNTLSDFAAFAGASSTTAQGQIRQSVLIAAFDDAATRGLAASSNAAALQHLQNARAEVQTRSSYQAIGANALSWVPYLKIVFENLYYGAFPIALVLMMTPLALTVARSYFGGFVWLAAWEPLSAILHSIMLNATAERFSTVTSTSATGAYTDSVVNWANHFGVYAIGQDVAATAGYLMMSVPFVASALFFGANKMTGLATSMLAVSQSSAAETGREVATGNLSYGNASVGNRSMRNYSTDNFTRNNASWNNTGANRTVTSPFSDTGRSSAYGSDGSLITRNADGSYGVDGGSSRVNTATSMSLGHTISGSLRESASGMMERGGALRRSVDRGISEVASRTSGFAQSVRSGELFSSSRGAGVTREDRESLSDAVSTVDSFSQQTGITTRTAAAVGIEAGLNGGARLKWIGLSGGLKASLSKEGITSENFEQVANAAHNVNLSQAVSQLSRSSRELSAQDSTGTDSTADKGMRETIDDLRRRSAQAETYERAADTYSTAADRVEADVVDNRTDVSGAFFDWMVDEKGYGVPQAVGMLNQRGEGSAEVNALRGEFAERYIDDLVKPEMSERFGAPLPEPVEPASPETAGEPHGFMQGHAMRRHAEGRLDVETGIIRGDDAVGRIGADGDALRIDAQRRGAEVQDQPRSAPGLLKDEITGPSASPPPAQDVLPLPSGVAPQGGAAASAPTADDGRLVRTPNGVVWDDGDEAAAPAPASRGGGRMPSLDGEQASAMSVVSNVAAQHGIDQADFVALAHLESNLRPDARPMRGGEPISSAGGLFQFIDSTASSYGLGNRYDPQESSHAAAELWSDNGAILSNALGRNVEAGEIYLAHQQGPGRAIQLLSGGDRPAPEVIGSAAYQNNMPAQHHLPEELRGRTLSAEEFAGLWVDKFDARRDRFASLSGNEGGMANAS